MGRQLTDLPNEVFFEVLGHLDNNEINTLFQVAPIRDRIQSLFACVSDITPSKHFTAVVSQRGFEEFRCLKEVRSQLLFVLVEINDLKNSSVRLPALSFIIDNKISIFDSHVSNNWYTGNNNSIWMQALGPRTKQVTFENVTKLSLTDLAFDPAVFKFPKLQSLRLSRCESSNVNHKFHFPVLEELYVDSLFQSINQSIDYKNASFKLLSLATVHDLEKWENITNSSIEEISIFESGSLIDFTNLKFEKLKKLIIKDSDVKEFSHLNFPSATSIHIEQFMDSRMNIHHVNAPALSYLLLWVYQIENLHDINTPSLRRASIMLSIEPEVTPNNNIDHGCFADLTSIQICMAAEILQHVKHLKELEVRGPFRHLLLYSLEFKELEQFRVYFNSHLTEVPKINAKNLESLAISRCASLSSLKSLEKDYPNITKLSIEYSGLQEMIDLKLLQLQSFFLMSSTSAPLSIQNCSFPVLEVFEATNLDIKSSEASRFQFTAPHLLSLRVTNFNIPDLEINFPNLSQLTATGGVDSLRISNCCHLRDLDISRNALKSVTTDPLSSLSSLECQDTNILQFELDTPLLKRIVYDEIIRYVLK